MIGFLVISWVYCIRFLSWRADERVRITNTRELRPAGGNGLTVGRGPPLRSITPSFNLPFNLSLNTPLNLSLDLSLDLSFDLPLLIYHWICHWVALAMKHLLFNSSIYHWICHSIIEFDLSLRFDFMTGHVTEIHHCSFIIEFVNGSQKPEKACVLGAW
jgi:hypothetical protein